LIEWANGPADSTWGTKRAAAGHPGPFHLQYLGVGNEDAQTEVFRERFKMICDAVKAKHPEITVIGTVGPAPAGTDYDLGWQFANERHLEIVDEHGYKPPEWFWDNLARFDAYDRAKSKVYLGEYAAHDTGRANTLRSALAEAAYMTALERNGDVVRLASYAPLLARQGHTQWRPDMIYFNSTNIVRSANYYVQQLFARNQGDTHLPTTIEGADAATPLAVSSVQSSATGDIIIKIVSAATNAIQVQMRLPQFGSIQLDGRRTVLAGDATAVNTYAQPAEVFPVTSAFAAGKSFPCEVLPNSLNVIRVRTR
jgi:alpha-L-arabinofuranosidase